MSIEKGDDDGATVRPTTVDKIAALAIAGAGIRVAEHACHVILPPGYTWTDVTASMEAAAPTPSRKRGSVPLSDTRSLTEYLKEHGISGSTRCYADQEKQAITAVLDDHTANDPTAGWRQHRATFQAEWSSEFAVWRQKNGVQMSQGDFATFIEDNYQDIVGEDAERLMFAATTLQAKSGITFTSSLRLQDGQTQLMYNEAIDASTGSTGEVTIPKTFMLGMPIFRHGPAYKLTARLKYRLGGGAVKFWYEIERQQQTIDAAFADHVERVEEAGFPVLRGSPE